MKSRTLLLAICGLCLFSVEASARNVFWALRDVRFNDGGTASGTFIYNVDTNRYSGTLITTTDGTARSGATYIIAGPTSDRIHGHFLTSASEDQTGLPGLDLLYNDILTNAGGDVPLVTHLFSLEYTCGNAACTVFAVPQRAVTDGYLHGTPLPLGGTAASSLGGSFRSNGKTVAAALPGGFSIQADSLSSRRSLPAAIPYWLTPEAYLGSAKSDFWELVA